MVLKIVLFCTVFAAIVKNITCEDQLCIGLKKIASNHGHHQKDSVHDDHNDNNNPKYSDKHKKSQSSFWDWFTFDDEDADDDGNNNNELSDNKNSLSGIVKKKQLLPLLEEVKDLMKEIREFRQYSIQDTQSHLWAHKLFHEATEIFTKAVSATYQAVQQFKEQQMNSDKKTQI